MMAAKKRCLGIVFLLLVFCGAAFSQGKERSTFSLKLSGGGRWSEIGDMNTHLGSLDQQYLGLPDVSGGIKTLDRLSGDWEVELKVEPGSRFSFGFAASYFQRRDSSSLTAKTTPTFGYDTMVSVKPEIRIIMPFGLRAYYSLHSSDRLNFFVSAGVGWYMARMKEAYIFNAIYPLAGTFYDNRYWDVRNNHGIGFVGGWGLELRILKRVSFVAELQARYLRISNLEGTVTYESNYGNGLTAKETGTLHFFSMGNYYDLDIPLPYHADVMTGVQNVERRAHLNLTGVALRLGIKVGLFRI